VITPDDLGAHLERNARAVAAVLVLIYCAGYECGRIVHQLNDFFAQLLPQSAEREPVAETLTPVALEQLTQRELMALAGVRRRLPKTILIQMIRQD